MSRSPDLISRDRRIIVDKFTGKGAVKARLQRLGVELDDKDITFVVEKIKAIFHRSAYTDEAFKSDNWTFRKRKKRDGKATVKNIINQR